MSEQLSSLSTILKEKFNIDRFRPGQLEIINAVLHKKDVLAVLPTGGGKSLCFQFPAVFAEQLVVVVSPLIALMKDQVSSLQRMNIPAGALYSGQTEDDKRVVFAQINRGGPFVLYLSPERVQKPGFQSWIQGRSISLFAIDEAHCVSQWGHDFRAEYGLLNILKKLRPDVPVLALTASATPLVLKDIAKQLNLQNPEKRVHGFYRPNLYFQVEFCKDDETKLALLLDGLRKHPTGRALIYCGTRKVTQSLAQDLEKEFSGVGFYHAGLSPLERTEVQEAYIRGDLRILVATNAFGMGIDQADVRLVVHYHMPSTIDSLYQEMGRAGRDGKDSTCMMLYSPKDKGLQSYFIQNSEAPKEIKNARWRNLEALVNYSEGGECRHAEILTYYQDAQRIQRCGHCDSCAPNSERRIQLKSPIRSLVKLIKAKSKSSAKGPSTVIVLTPEQENIFQILKQWRKQKADELDVPAFIIFSDRTLRALAIEMPSSKNDLKSVYGIGEDKMERFGAELIAILQNSPTSP
jgi:ATP-dependent DNA helicase RecQ